MKIQPDAILTVTQNCDLCLGTGVRDKAIIRCMQCHHAFTDEELAVDEAACNTYYSQYGDGSEPEPLMSCGHWFHSRDEDNVCPRCKGVGQVTMTVSIRDLARAITEIQEEGRSTYYGH